ncbi:unnamed protein product [Darwinula stevensoni]|uniref:IGFBP N-terminal domain-containing protein n=1 Tax=Darwinula stevensoni TaxID=69355 RepID=A0A7R9FRV7_9CRUS|nr:unnamed protein product [Darwinula stevensoni]CAG0902491.1 unnamed protein product [Darwinula stevensoni]
MKLLVLVVLAFLLFAKEGEGLTCPECNREECPVLDESTCGAGVSTDACGCCPRCFKDLGEGCGGPWNVFGRCGGTMTCRKVPGPFGTDDYTWNFNARGTCVQ